MRDDLKRDILQRIERDYGFKTRGRYLRGGTCPVCSKKEMYTSADHPWVLRCGRLSKCGAELHVKDIYDDLFNDWSARAPATSEVPDATARAYLEFNRGLRMEVVAGWFSQENYWDRELNIGSATVRFPLPAGGYWERLIDRPHRFGKKKARFKPGFSARGHWWVPPSVDLEVVDELWVVEGIFDCLALLHNGIDPVSAMSSNNFPETPLRELAEARRAAGRKLPTLVWALDNEPGAHRYTRKHARLARELGFVCEAAQIPQRDKKVDWNDLHQRWLFVEGDEARAERIERDLNEARYHGRLLLADSAAEKGVLMYEWRERHEFFFGFESRMYWFKMNLEKFNKAMQDLESSEREEDVKLDDRQRRAKALRMCGAVTEIANCYPQALYFQRNAVTDESWYYFKVDFPHDAPSVRNTFTGGQVAAASEFKKRLLSMAAGAVFTGSGSQLDKIMKDQLFGLKSVETVDFIGYSREHRAYVFRDIAVHGGLVERANQDDYFEFNKLRLKTLQRSMRMEIDHDGSSYRPEWLDWLWTCFGAKGVAGLAFWFGSLFAEQIRDEYQSFPFLEVTGEAGAGKSTLLQFLWKLLGRPDEEGRDPTKGSKVGLRRWMGQVSGMPLVMLEADREDIDAGSSKAFNWDEFKPLYNGGTLGVTGVKTAGNETYEPPFRGTIVISQNKEVVGSEAIMTRIVKLHFERPQVTSASRAAADNLNLLGAMEVSHFLLKATRAEQSVMECFRKQVRVHEARLRGIESIRVERIIKNHAQMLALLDALCLVVPLSEQQVDATRATLEQMAMERQSTLSADHQSVREFWEVYEYLEGLEADSLVNHSTDPTTIAINLNEFWELASEHRQRLADLPALRGLLRESRQHKFIEANRAVYSAIRVNANRKSNANNQRPTAVKCWVFRK